MSSNMALLLLLSLLLLLYQVFFNIYIKKEPFVSVWCVTITGYCRSIWHHCYVYICWL